MNIRAFLLSGTMVLTSAAYAQSWISSTGADSNPCTRTQPCATLAHAVNVTASGGKVNVVDPADYQGVTITKAITIDGGGFASSFLAGIVVQAPAGQIVQLRNLSIDGNNVANSSGISFLSGGQLLIDHVKVTGFGLCVNVALTGSGYTDLVIKDSSINNCENYGISITANGPSLTAEITNTTVTASDWGLFADAGRLSISGSTFSSPNVQSGQIGIQISGADAMIDNCQITRFLYGLYVSTSAQLSRRTLSYNGTGALQDGTGIINSLGNNSFYTNSTNGTVTRVAFQ
jgi:hypothetical protein